MATSWTHPVRGLVGCPAHRLLTAHAQQAGYEAHSQALPHTVMHSDSVAPTTVFTVSYENPDGGHRGLAIAVHGSDTTAAAFARRQIASWSAVLRTRRVLYVLPRKPERRADTAQGPDAAVPGQQSGHSPAPWRPCGCPSTTACGSAENAARSLRRFLDREDDVIVVGAPNAPGSAAWRDGTPHADGRAVATPRQAESLAVADPDRLAFVVAPGTAVTEAARILSVLRRRFPRLKGQHPREWCYTMDDLHTAVGSVLAQSDILLVTGRGDSPVVRTALTQAAGTGVRVRDIRALDHLCPQDTDAATIALLDASADERVNRQVAQALDGLGPASHVHRQVRSTALTHSATSPGPARPMFAEGPG
ncbi:4-hydroxy-3-methylbut-2-enyl diphosphate reductase [Streptomyces sp. NPDC058470]|uniref:4-hydroxy-3-methylbut-2-enyl diphosphate reductase n=1 Tax=Streptomyces sp. NPDC058470 TaxID=3346515 RepID=UPI003652EE68